LPIGTAVHERTFPLCESLNYREWSGYYTVSAYEAHHEHEYNAIRNAAALIDITPLYKYLVTGKDATRLVNRVIARDINKVAIGQVIYTCWCDEQGKVIDDGTISRLAENTYRWTAADPSLRWFQQNALGMDVHIEDISEQTAALALQGPTSGKLLEKVVEGADIKKLKYFHVTSGKLAGVPVDISRTGYTGDLGYEIWMEPLPRTSTGKIKRFEVERRVRDTEARREAPGGPVLDDADRAWLARDDLAPILELVGQAARPGSTVAPEANLELDLGLDSMERVELLTALEQRMGADIPEEELQRLYTVRQLAESLLAHARGVSAEASGSWETLLVADPARQASYREWLAPHVVVPAVLFLALKAVRLVLRAGVKVTLTGVEHFPPRGPYLISPNHQSFLDPFFLVSMLPYRVARQLFFVGAAEYFETPLTRWLARQVNLVPVDPDAALVSAMQAGAAGLREGRILMLFPEGERAIDGSVRHFKKGAAILSQHLGVPIVPVALRGVYEIWPRNRALNWRALLPGAGTEVRLQVGVPVRPDAAERGDQAYKRLTADLRAAVTTMFDALG